MGEVRVYFTKYTVLEKSQKSFRYQISDKLLQYVVLNEFQQNIKAWKRTERLYYLYMWVSNSNF